ncbi:MULTISPECIES: FmdB family zinc ribbon protein [unclassified Frankia]|uniref:FmdB family zinc ribbon protein n=1 Tax=unclassified Frankia TaxID=2632575 RepID=UPI001EF641C6|nr:MULTISPECIES: FmdB family zinc ribbon protein [unclassified Frankia]
MPRYEYRCTACDNDLEVVQSFNDAALTECPACGGKLRRVFSSVGVVFKGAGFYKTDSRSGGGGARDRAKEKVSKEAGADTSGKETVGAGTPAGGGSVDATSSAASSSTSASTASSSSSGSSSSSSGGSSTAAA